MKFLGGYFLLLFCFLINLNKIGDFKKHAAGKAYKSTCLH